MPHQELGSKEDFEKAIGEQGKYVLILAYNGSVHPKAEEAAEAHAGTTASYKVDIGKQEAAGKGIGLTVEDTPAVVIFKDGAKIKTIKNVSAANASEIGAVLSS